MNPTEPQCLCGHDRPGHRIESPWPCKTCGPLCTGWRRDFDRERRLREADGRPETAGKLITPQRAKELRRAAARHAGGMILVSLIEWDPSEYFPDEAERDLVLEEIERIGNEIKTRAIAGTSRPCGSCGFSYVVRGDGMMRFHHGVDVAGFSTGERCPGVGEPPRTA